MTISANFYLYRFRLLAMRHGLDLILRQIQIQRFKSGYIRKMRDRIGLYTFQDAKVVTVCEHGALLGPQVRTTETVS